ncbi:hypothetical protein H0H92_002048 [Tricholoma furcatifolium]|nr:hypothetical protein H0H92_002048 [Tricholoma furcatifolium]
MPLNLDGGEIKAIDKTSIHRITSGQVVIDLQTAVKELVENSLDAGATNIEVRFKQHGLKSIEVIDNGSGIPEAYHDSIALKHYTSKLSSFSDLATVRTFGFRGEALSSLCALSESLSVITATEPPMGATLEMASSGQVAKRSKIARQRGTTVTVTNLFKPLPVRRKEFERNVKREFGKALGLLNAYALISTGIRLTVSNVADKGQKTVQLRTSGASTSRALVSELWGPKALDNVVDLDLTFEVDRDKTSLKRIQGKDGDVEPMAAMVKGLISKFSIGGGRTGTDRQFFYVNGRPCNLSKVQKAFNEAYRSFNATQSPFILANFIIPTESCDINVSPDKRTIFLHNESNLVAKLKAALEGAFAPSRSTFDVGSSQSQRGMTQTVLSTHPFASKRSRSATEEHDHLSEGVEPDEPGPKKKRLSERPSSPPSRISDDEEILSSLPSLTGAGSGKYGACGSMGRASVVAQTSKPKGKTRPQNSLAQGDLDQDQNEEEQVDDRETRTSVLPASRAMTVQKGKPTILSYPPLSNRSPTRVQILDDETQHLAGYRARNQFEGAEPIASPASPFSPLSSPTRMAAEVRTASPRPLHHPSQEPVSIAAQMSDDSMVVGDDDEHGNRDEEEEQVPQVQLVDNEDETMGMGVELEPPNDPPIVLDTTRTAWSHSTLTQKAVRNSSLASLSRSSRATGINGTEPTLTTANEYQKVDAISNMNMTSLSRTRPATAEHGEDLIETEVGESDPLFLEDDGGPQDASLSGPSSPPAAPLLKRPSSRGERDADLPESRHSSSMIDLTTDDFDDSHIISMVDETTSALQYEETVYRPEVIRTSDIDSGDITLRFNLDRISDAWLRLGSGAPSMNEVESHPLRRVPSDAGVANTENDETAVKALARIIDKKDFAAMDIVGQFNLGFIVTRRQIVVSEGEEDTNAVMDDLFIVDQHAADEKYNFEILQQTTTINSQKLFKPRRMELTASDELIALENTDILRQNGFEVEEVEEASRSEMQGAKLCLVAQPVSKSTIFDMKDLEELIHLMRDRPSGQMVRCSKARAMFAMRACRKSVMVGMPLNKQQMTTARLSGISLDVIITNKPYRL